jgi:exonuclease III
MTERELLTIATLNARSVRRKVQYLRNALDNNSIDVLAIQETRLRPRDVNFKVGGYAVVCKDGDAGQVGVALLFRDGLAFSHLDLPAQFHGVEAIMAQVPIAGNRMATVCNLYSSPNASLPFLFIRYLERTYKDLILLGDLNASSTEVGCPHDNHKANDIIRVFNETNLVPMNMIDPRPTRMGYAGQRDNLLDWIITSSPVAARIENFYVDYESELDSDHLTVVASFRCAPVRDDELPPRSILCYKRGDMDGYRRDLEELLIPLDRAQPATKAEIDNLNAELVQAITTAAEANFPRVTLKGPRKWWKFSPEAQEHKRARARHRRQSIRHKDDPGLRAYHRQMVNYHTHELTSTNCREKMVGWQAFCENLRSSQDSKNFHRTFNTFKKGRLSPAAKLPTMKHNNQEARTSVGKAQLCADYLATVFRTPQGPAFDDAHEQMVNAAVNNNPRLFRPADGPLGEPRQGDLDATILPGEITPLMKHLKPTAPGPDGISNILLKEGPPRLASVLAKLFDASLELGYLTSSWKEAHLTMLPKPGKALNTPANLRPISLLNTIGKLMERIIANRLRSSCEENNIFPDTQAGFRAGRSTYDHLLHLTEQCLSAMERRESTLAVFLDIKKAFDCVWHNGLRYRLMQLNLPPRILRWLSHFLIERRMRCKVNGFLSNEFTADAGVPQGSILSPLLYIIYVRDMVPESSFLNATAQFADDTALWSNNGRNQTAVQGIQRGLDLVHQWTSKWRLAVSAAKTQMICIGRSRRNIIEQLRANPVHYGPDQLELQVKAKFLGLTFDRLLNFHDHIKEVKKRAMAPALLLKAFHGNNWSVPERSLLIIYKTHVLPILTYGSICTMVAPTSYIKKLQVVQNTALRKIYNLPYGAASEPCHRLSRLPRLNDRLVSLSQRYFARASTKPFFDIIERHHRFRPRPGRNRQSLLDLR